MATPTWLGARSEHLTGAARLGGIDLARGLAVVGMLAAHLLTIPEWSPPDPGTWLGLVHGRSSILFATLAGVSIGLISGGESSVVGAALGSVRLRLVVRAILLWMLGLLLIATGVPVHVILPAYALLFLFALPLLTMRPTVLLSLAGTLAAIAPFVVVAVNRLPGWTLPVGELVGTAIGWHYPFPVWMAFVAAGLGIARLGVRRLRVQVGLLGWGALLAVIGYGADAVTRPGAAALGSWGSALSAASHSNGVWEAVGSGGFALAMIGLCLLACRTPVGWVLLPLRAVGAMPLTAYTAQLLVWALWAQLVLGETDDLFGFRALDPFPPLVIGTVVGCTAWALLIGRGPLEAAVDRIARLAVPRR